MHRSVFVAGLCVALTWGHSAAAQTDAVRKQLEDAKADYDKAIKEYKEEVEKWFDKEDDSARKSKSDVAKRVKQVAEEKTSYEEKGVLPKRAPLALRDRPAKATEAMLKAYKTASDEYLRNKKDDEAAAVEKELAAFKRDLAEKPQPKAAALVDAKLFTGRWRLVDEKGVTVGYFTLTSALEAKKAGAPTTTGTWEVVGREARITWSDGWKDILRPDRDGVLKIAFGPGTSWDDKPANTHRAVKER